MRNETANPPVPGKKTDKPPPARMSEGGANAPPSEADLARALQLAAHEALGGGGDAGEHLERLHRMQLAHSERTAGVERKYEAASLELERALAENEGLRGDVSRLSHDLMASKEHTRMSLTSALERIDAAARRIDNPAAERNPASAHLFIIDPLHAHAHDRLLATHPPTANRVRALRALAGESVAPAPRRTLWSRRGPWG